MTPSSPALPRSQRLLQIPDAWGLILPTGRRKTVSRKREQSSLRIEGQAGAQVDRAGDTALDHFRGLVLVGVDARHQFRGHVAPLSPRDELALKVSRPLNSVRTGEAATTTPEGSAKMGCVAGGGEAIDRDARHALQRLSDGLVGKRRSS